MALSNHTTSRSISHLYLHSKADAPRLRVGVLVNSYTLSRAYRAVLEDLAAADFIDLVLVVRNDEPRFTREESGNRFGRWWRKLADPVQRRTLLYQQYAKFEGRRPITADPLQPVDCTDLLGNAELLSVIPERKRFVQRLTTEDVDTIKSYELDVLLRFGFDIIKGEVLNAARYGIWSYHHDDNEFYRGGPPLLWELIEGNPCSGVILQVLSERLDDGLVLRKAVFATNQGILRKPNTYYPYWGSVHFVIRTLHLLHENGWDAVLAAAPEPRSYKGKQPIYRAPDNVTLARWLLPELARRAVRLIRPPATIHYWQIQVRKRNNPSLPLQPSDDFRDGVTIPSPRGHFYADPFLLQVDGQTWLFFEDYIYAERRGRICATPLSGQTDTGPVTTVLDLPNHLSYPMVFHHDGEIFMIPESSSLGEVRLYRANRFPHDWSLEKILYKGRAVDTTPFLHEGTWYFFTTLSEPGGNGFFSALFHADSLDGTWRFHPQTPISTDVRTARSAGRIIQVNGDILRPVQDCTETYGRRLRFMRIDELSTSRYSELETATIEPGWHSGIHGVHTYAYENGLEVVDALRLARPTEAAVTAPGGTEHPASALNTAR